jgi:hypothetical protein
MISFFYLFIGWDKEKRITAIREDPVQDGRYLYELSQSISHVLAQGNKRWNSVLTERKDSHSESRDLELLQDKTHGKERPETRKTSTRINCGPLISAIRD